MGSGQKPGGLMGSGPLGSGPLGSAPLGSAPLGSAPLGSGPLGSGLSASLPPGVHLPQRQAVLPQTGSLPPAGYPPQRSQAGLPQSCQGSPVNMGTPVGYLPSTVQTQGSLLPSPGVVGGAPCFQAGLENTRGNPTTVTSYVASAAAAQVESLLENEFVDLLAKTQFPPVAHKPEVPELPADGELDRLLEPGNSRELLSQLPEIFKNEPPVDAGRQPHAAGMFHGFNSTYGRRVFSPKAVATVLDLATEFYADAPNITRLTVPADGRLVIVGDTHGQLEDVLWVFFKHGAPSPQNVYLFDGDIVDRGGHALEILLLLLTLKRDEPRCVHIIRGNHEDEVTCQHHGFRAELDSKYGPGGHGGWIAMLCNTKVFPSLPIVATVSDALGRSELCVLHGGIPVAIPGMPETVTVQTLSRINRKVQSVQTDRSSCASEDHVLFHLLWADPCPDGRAPVLGGATGRGNQFSAQQSVDFCTANNFTCVIRAHQPPEDKRGFANHHGGHCMTVFTASNYCGNLGNWGGVIICDSRGRPYAPVEHYAPAWKQLSDVLRENAGAPQARCFQIAEQVEAGVPPVGAGSALQQVQLYVTQQIVRHKQKIFEGFTEVDTARDGWVSLEAWQRVMSAQLSDIPPVWEDLGRSWELANRVSYVTFLSRFQITTELLSNPASTHTDLFSAMNRLRGNISDVCVADLMRGLDQDLDGSVDLHEFQAFLKSWNVDIPPWQSASLYQTLLNNLQRNPVTEDVLLTLALISDRPQTSPCGSEWLDSAKNVGKAILRSGRTLVGFFLEFDADKNGFLSTEELEAALCKGLPGFGSAFSREQVEALISTMDAQGVANGRVSLVEFLRAVGPRKLEMQLSKALLGEVLKPVFFHRSVLEAVFQRYDPSATNVVSLDQFRAGLVEMNRIMTEEGDTVLSEYELEAVAEIASGCTREVQYREFLRSLRTVDTNTREKGTRAAVDCLRAALQPF